MRILAAVLAFVCLPAVAQECIATLSWTAPTERTDGSPLTNLAGFKVYWGTSPGSYTSSATIDNPGVTSYVVESLAAATWYFAATAYDSNGFESGYSNEATKTTSGCTAPNPPTNLTVGPGDRFAYELILSRDRVAFNVVGRVPAGTPCDGSQRIGDRFVVPRDAVEWLGDAMPAVVVSSCASF